MTREVIGRCEGCGKEIIEGQNMHVCAGGQFLCEEHAPMLSDLIRQYTEIVQAPDFHPGDLDVEDREELVQALDSLRAEIDANGDRKLLVTA